MIVLGIDPGLATVGYGVVHAVNTRFLPLGHGVIRTSAGQPLHLRLAEIYDDMQTLIAKFRPDCAAIEELFFNTNEKTAILVAQARGCILLALSKSGLAYREYTPLQVKQAVVGYGRAEKHQVMELTRLQLGLEKIPKPDDAADALAIALCHARSATSILYK